MRSKRQGIILILLSIPFIYLQNFYAGLFLSLFGFFLLYKWWENPIRVLEDQIKIDAQKYKVQIPISYPLHLEFLKIYTKYLRLKTQFPNLKNTYIELVDSMWLKLSLETNPQNWKKILRSTDENWPTPLDLNGLLQSNLNKAKR